MENHFRVGTVIEYIYKKKEKDLKYDNSVNLPAKTVPKNLSLLFIIFFGTETKFKVSDKSLSICNKRQLLSIISVIVDLIEVRTCFNAEKVFSGVAEVTGIVKY